MVGEFVGRPADQGGKFVMPFEFSGLRVIVAGVELDFIPMRSLLSTGSAFVNTGIWNVPEYPETPNDALFEP
jgi:hypothetical protein